MDKSDEGDGNGGNESKMLLILGVVVIGIPVLIVVGMILVVVLSAVLGTFVLGLGGDVPTDAPAANFGYDNQAGSLTVTHEGGDAIDAQQLVILVNGQDRGTWADRGTIATVRAGNEVTVHNLERGDSVRLQYRETDGRTTLSVYEVP